MRSTADRAVRRRDLLDLLHQALADGQFVHSPDPSARPWRHSIAAASAVPSDFVVEVPGALRLFLAHLLDCVADVDHDQVADLQVFVLQQEQARHALDARAPRSAR